MGGRSSISSAAPSNTSWTTSGPEPVDYQQSPLDYDHYLTKQLQPVAEGDPALRQR
ncbi:hypothetical protein LNQ03_12430 [Klebsiella pneumoniae subsp. pneumoniae]|nr:hypothetical protein [Klebsiella pneumoniae subsp. pneumoniae]